MRVWVRWAVIIVGVVIAGPVLADPLDAALAANLRGDYTTEFRIVEPLARQGNVAAQAMLGLLYDSGQGVPQDYDQAVKWYWQAAWQGNAQAQTNLGVMYDIGRGVPQDVVRAHAWSNLGAAGGSEIGRKNRDVLANGMTPAQITQAQQFARDWKLKITK